MYLKAVSPLEELQRRFDGNLQVKEYGIKDLAELVRDYPSKLQGCALNVWNRIVFYSGKRVNPRALAGKINVLDPPLFKEIERVIGDPVITDLYGLCAVHPSYPAHPVAMLFVFRVFPNTLHLADVNFIAPDKPLPKSKQSLLRTHQGLGLLKVVMNRLKSYAVAHKIDYITLTAAFKELVPVFERHGFKVENNPMGVMGLETGECIPMDFRVQ